MLAIIGIKTTNHWMFNNNKNVAKPKNRWIHNMIFLKKTLCSAIPQVINTSLYHYKGI